MKKLILFSLFLFPSLLKAASNTYFVGTTSVTQHDNARGLILISTRALILNDLDNSNYVGIVASNTISSDSVWVWPSADGSAGQSMVTDGNKNLSFTTISGGGGGSITSTTVLTGFQPYSVLVASSPGTNLYTNVSGIRIDHSMITGFRGPNIIGGFEGNTIATQTYGSVISGGGALNFENKINYSTASDEQDPWATICGGYDNQITSAWPSVICGGAHNRINQSHADPTYFDYLYESTKTTNHVFILGGTYGTIQNSAYGTVIGGSKNTIATYYSGAASADFSHIVGNLNYAGGPRMFLGGFRNTGIGQGHTVFGEYNDAVGGTYNGISSGYQNLAVLGNYGAIGGGTLNRLQNSLGPRIYRIDLSAQSSGSFELSYGGQTTSSLAYNASTTTIDSALEGLSSVGTGNVVVSTTGTGLYRIVFSSSAVESWLYAYGSQLSGPSSFFVNPGTSYSVSIGAPSTGTFRLTYGRLAATGNSSETPAITSTIPYNASASTVQSALESLPSVGIGSVTVSGADGGPYQVSFDPVVSIYGLSGNGLSLVGGALSITGDATATDSFVGAGNGNIVARSDSGIVSGRNNWIHGQAQFIGAGFENGISSTATGASIVSGRNNKIGSSTLTDSSWSSVLAGTGHKIDGLRNVILNGSTNTILNANDVTIGGLNTFVSSTGATAFGSNHTVSAQRAMSAGGLNNTLRGLQSFALAGTFNTVTGANGASGGTTNFNSGSGAFTFGSTLSSSGAFSAAFGQSNSIGSGNNGDYSMVAGFSNQATSRFALVTGRANLASGENTVASGRGALADHWGEVSQAGGFFVSTGDAQGSVLVGRRQTVDGTTGYMTLDGSTTSFSNRITLSNDSSYVFSILIVARRTDSDNESAGYKIEGLIDRQASVGTINFVGTPVKTVLGEDDPDWDVDVVVDVGSGSGLAIIVTGESGKTINWVARVTLVKVTG